MLHTKLQQFGFSDKEAKVYLALLEIGSAVASDIAKKSDIKRSTVYIILDTLAQRGLVSVTERQGVTLYNSTPPERLIQHLKSMANRYSGFADTAKELLPELKSFGSPSIDTASTPKVKLFEGNEGVKTVYEDILTSLEGIRVHANFKNTSVSIAPPAAKKKHSVDSELVVQTVFLDTPSGRKHSASDKKNLRKTILMSRGEHEPHSEMNIYDDRIVFISSGENFALVVESRELAGALKKMCTSPVHKTAKQKKSPRRGNLQTSAGEFAPAFI